MATNSSVAAGDDSFGPQLNGQFDFTLTFEHVVMTIVPTVIFVCVTPLSVYRLFRKPARVRPGLLLWAKLVSSFIANYISLYHHIYKHRHAILLFQGPRESLLVFWPSTVLTYRWSGPNRQLVLHSFPSM